MADPPSLLFICPCTPDPRGTGWEQRAYSLVLGYGRLMAVDLWFMPTPDNPDIARLTPLLSVVRSVVAFYPPLFEQPEYGFRQRLGQSLDAADLVHVSRLPKLVAGLGHDQLVWDIDERPWANPPDPEAQAMVRRAARNCKLVLGSSSRERPEAARRYEVVPNVVPLPESSPDNEAKSAGDGPRLLFVGNLNYLPNIDALVFFHDEVLPVLLERIPEIRLLVVGRSPVIAEAKAAFDQLRRNPHLEFALDVPDCASYYDQCTVAIAPIRLGGGTRIKILEAFAHGRPVVSTTKGCEGLDVRPGVHLQVADDAREFAAQCEQLALEPHRRREMSTAAGEFVRRNHTQAAVDEILAATIGTLTAVLESHSPPS